MQIENFEVLEFATAPRWGLSFAWADLAVSLPEGAAPARFSGLLRHPSGSLGLDLAWTSAGREGALAVEFACAEDEHAGWEAFMEAARKGPLSLIALSPEGEPVLEATLPWSD